MGKFCTSCGEALLPDFKFCGECGAPIAPVKTNTSNFNSNTQVRTQPSTPAFKRADTAPSFSTTKRSSSGSVSIPNSRTDITVPQARSLDNKTTSTLSTKLSGSEGSRGGGGSAREEAKKEEAYIRSGGTANEIRKIEAKREKELQLQSSLDPSSCYCCFRTVSYKMLNKPTGRPDCMVL